MFPLIERVDDDHHAVEIVSRKGNAVLMSADEYAAWQETASLFRSPANARRLHDAYDRARAGKTQAHELDRSDGYADAHRRLPPRAESMQHTVEADLVASSFLFGAGQESRLRSRCMNAPAAGATCSSFKVWVGRAGTH